MLREVPILISKEFTLELRKKSVISAIGLYLLSLIFISYMSFNLGQGAVSESTWSALFWITILFSAITTVSKTFIGEKRGLAIYYFTIASGSSIIVSKIIYNTILCFVLSLVGYGLFQVLIPGNIDDHLIFITTLLLTSVGFSASLSLISGISSKAGNSNLIMAVLSFPVIIGILLMSIKITKNLLDQLDRSLSYDELLNLLAIDIIVSALAAVLFPFVWRS